MFPNQPRRQEEPVAEARTYATLLRIGTRASTGVLVLTFLLYVGGVAPPVIPIDRLPDYWGLGASEYLRQASLPNGWGWVRLVGFGDFLNYVGIAMLASLTILCYLAIFPVFVRKNDTPYVLMVLAEITVLLLAASGLLAVGP
jgi:hypothetical protein